LQEKVTKMLDECTPWPEALAAAYREGGYWKGHDLNSLLSQKWPEREAIVSGTQRWTYGELNRAAARLAAGLAALGIQPNHRVVVQLPNVPELVLVCFALFRIGALPVFALPAHRASEITHLCEISEAVAYVAPRALGRFDFAAMATQVRAAVPSLRSVLLTDGGGDRGAVIDADSGVRVDAEPVAPNPVRPEDVALFLLSGGTTGLPKLIPRTHDDYSYNVRASAEVCGFSPEDTYLAVLPIAHNFALGCPGVLGVLNLGGRVVMAESGSPDEAFALIERERVTVTALVPPLAMLWLEAAGQTKYDLSSLRLLQVGGAKFNVEPAKRVRSSLGCTLQQVFGMAEGLLNFTRLDDSEELIVSTQGKPLSPADELRIVNEDGVDVPPGEVGHLLTRGPYTLRGYYRAAAHNATAFTTDGFFLTGDLVRQLPSGHLVVEGRIKDQINRGGDKISAAEVEGHLLAHPNVQDVALVPIPDAILGERTCAVVVPRGEAPKLSALNSFLRGRGLAGYKLPDRVEIVESFPRTSVGKISKRALAAMLADSKATRHLS
jgi:2,3-dihydroxybenzoate-AMP ligase